MSYYDVFSQYDGKAGERFSDQFPSRAETIRKVSGSHFDLLVVGGGIHGANAAWMAALSGLKVALLERADYASATSGRSSKMLHGGLRYLELFDFEQVREGLHARESMFQNAHHLAQPQEFMIPIEKSQWWYPLKMKVGLTIYDYLSGNVRKHMWRERSHQQFGELAQYDSLRGGFVYCDGIMKDSRITVETIIAARQEGALALNYADVILCNHRKDNRVVVSWRDVLSGEKYEMTAGSVFNCAGPWVPTIGRVTPAEFSSRISYSQGSHLLFNKQWKGPALILPLPERARYYFVWPHPYGTMVGPTEHPVTELPVNPVPSTEEVEHLLERLRVDLPGSGLDRSTLHYAYAGIRTLPRDTHKKKTGTLSRKHQWVFQNGVLSLIGGKFTTAQWTAYEGLKQILQHSKGTFTLEPLQMRALPGAAPQGESFIRDFREVCRAKNIPQRIVERTVQRLGALVRYILEEESRFEVIGDTLLSGEISCALHIEQAETFEDLMRRRLELEYSPDHGIPIADDISRILVRERQGYDATKASEDYVERLKNLHLLLKIPT